MKTLLFSLLTFLSVQAHANMANPVLQGTLGSRPFVNQYVDVLNEDLLIKVDTAFKTALFTVKYHINSTENGIKIPFLFYASEFLGDFIVKIDGEEIPIRGIPYSYDIPGDAKFQDFSYFYENPEYTELSDVVIQQTTNVGFVVNLHDMIYFETNISKGEHIIEVSYKASVWTDTWDSVNKYSFRYALSPAQYWRSFGNLHVIIDATDFNQSLTTNVDSVSIDSIRHLYFNELPIEILQVNFNPTINKKSQKLIEIGPSGLAYMTGGVLFIIHLILAIWYRRINLTKKYSLVVIIGSLIVPLLFVYSWVEYYGVIDNVIGEYASRGHGYTFFVVVLYPLITPVYWVFFWLVDKRVKRKYLSINE